MNEITRIHLASIPFNIEIGAKKELEKYLAGVEKSLAADKDTIREIEARIVEIVNERGVVEEKVITSDDVVAVTEQLGQPEAFVDEEALDAERSTVKAPKRLYRDTDTGMLTGVCSGIAAFFKTDVTLVRLLTLILIPLTAGAILPVYIVLAIITPAAKTAAQKLQMAGEPVTLNSLKEQSAITPAGEKRQMLLRIVTIIAGIGFAVLAVVTLGTLAVVTIHEFDYVFSQNWRLIGIAIAFGLGGLLLVSLLTLLAYASFAMKFTKKIGFSLLAIAMTGLLLGAMGTLGINYSNGMLYGNNYQEVEERIDSSVLVGAKKLVVDSDARVSVDYITNDNDALMNASYSFQSGSNGVNDSDIRVKLTDSNGAVRLEVDGYGNRCKGGEYYCGLIVHVVITGPKLESIDLSNGNSLSYHVDSGQEKLTTNQRDTDDVLMVYSSLPIKSLASTISGGAMLDASRANIINANVSALDNFSFSTFARIKSYGLTVPETCGDVDAEGELSVLKADKIIVNGKPYQKDTDYPCATITVGDRNDNGVDEDFDEGDASSFEE